LPASEVCLLWVAKGIEQNFGKEIKEWVSSHPKEKMIVHDTAVMGRPNVSEMSVEAAKKWGAEVVIVTSNPEGSRDVKRGFKIDQRARILVDIDHIRINYSSLGDREAGCC
nr:adenylate-forming reductase 03009-like [Tanacetum cinerariifolium]